MLQCVGELFDPLTCFALQVFYDPVKRKSIELRDIKVDKSEIRAIRNVNGETYFMSQNKVCIFDFVCTSEVDYSISGNDCVNFSADLVKMLYKYTRLSIFLGF